MVNNVQATNILGSSASNIIAANGKVYYGSKFLSNAGLVTFDELGGNETVIDAGQNVVFGFWTKSPARRR